jgi:Flp pilus assembly CpaF family ATPase
LPQEAQESGHAPWPLEDQHLVHRGMVQQQIASAVHVFVQISRLSDGTRRVMNITEVTGAGRFSVIVDPTGAPLGLWEPKS